MEEEGNEPDHGIERGDDVQADQAWAGDGADPMDAMADFDLTQATQEFVEGGTEAGMEEIFMPLADMAIVASSADQAAGEGWGPHGLSALSVPTTPAGDAATARVPPAPTDHTGPASVRPTRMADAPLLSPLLDTVAGPVTPAPDASPRVKEDSLSKRTRPASPSHRRARFTYISVAGFLAREFPPAASSSRLTRRATRMIRQAGCVLKRFAICDVHCSDDPTATYIRRACCSYSCISEIQWALDSSFAICGRPPSLQPPNWCFTGCSATPGRTGIRYASLCGCRLIAGLTDAAWHPDAKGGGILTDRDSCYSEYVGLAPAATIDAFSVPRWPAPALLCHRLASLCHSLPTAPLPTARPSHGELASDGCGLPLGR